MECSDVAFVFEYSSQYPKVGWGHKQHVTTIGDNLFRIYFADTISFCIRDIPVMNNKLGNT